MIVGEDPQETLLKKSNDWTKDLASEGGTWSYLHCSKSETLSLSPEKQEFGKVPKPSPGISAAGMSMNYIY